MNQNNIRNFCIIAHNVRFAYETPILRVSHRAGLGMNPSLGLLFPVGGQE